MSDPIATLRASHERLAALVEPLTPDQVTAQAYPIEWSIAQAMSHLGSAPRSWATTSMPGSPARTRRAVRSPSRSGMPELQASPTSRPATRWPRTVRWWSGSRPSPTTSAPRSGSSCSASTSTSTAWPSTRLNEHTLHSWDVAVTLDPSATLALDSTALVVDNLGAIVRWTGKASEGGPTVHVVTNSPDRSFTLSLADPVSLTDGEGGEAELRLPAEALVRLVYGRLDPDHTPALSVTGVDLDDLRRTFPGL